MIVESAPAIKTKVDIGPRLQQVEQFPDEFEVDVPPRRPEGADYAGNVRSRSPSARSKYPSRRRAASDME